MGEKTRGLLDVARPVTPLPCVKTHAHEEKVGKGVLIPNKALIEGLCMFGASCFLVFFPPTHTELALLIPEVLLFSLECLLGLR